jgi:hypothetical protein
MKKILYQIANYNDHRQTIFENNYVPITKEFCKRHGYEYYLFQDECSFRNCSWQKLFKLKQMITNLNLEDDDRILFLDADTTILDLNEDFPFIKKFNYAIDNGNTHCMGIWSMIICPWTKKLLDNLMDDDLYNQCKHQELWYQFSEQGAWYTLAGISRHSWISYFEIMNYGWNSTTDNFYRDKIKYSVEELKENVQVLGPEWNSTILEEEYNVPGIAVYENYVNYPDYLKQYNIVKSKLKDVKIRHFAGGQPWRIYKH